MFCQHFARSSLSCSLSASRYVTKPLNSIRFVSLNLVTKNSSTFNSTRKRLSNLHGRLWAPSVCGYRVGLSSFRQLHMGNRLCNSGASKAVQTNPAKKADFSRILSLAKKEKYRLIGRCLC